MEAAITEFVQYGVIGLAGLLIVSQIVIVKAFLNLWVKCLDDMKILSTNIGNEIKTLNATMYALTTKVEMLTVRTKMVKGALQSGIINNGE